jgi:hypothetical protein
MQLRELLRNSKISLRTYSICLQQQWHTLEDIRNYYREQGHFMSVENTDTYIEEELKSIIFTTFEESFSDIPYEPSHFSIDTLSPAAQEILQEYIGMLTESLSPRLKTVINTYFRQGVPLQIFCEYALDPLRKSFKMKGIGRRNGGEFHAYFEHIKKFVTALFTITDPEQLPEFKKKFFIQSIYPIEKIPKEVTLLGIFKIVDYFLKTPALFDESKIALFSKAFRIYNQTQGAKLKTIGKQMQITHERVRQIRNQAVLDFLSKLTIIQSFETDLFARGQIDISSEVLSLSPEQVQWINQQSHTDFTENFIYFILHIYLERFSIVGNLSDVLYLRFSQKKTRHNWKGIYLVSREIASVLPWEKLVESVSELLKEKVEKDYGLPLKEYLLKFRKADAALCERMIPIVAHVLKGEFSLRVEEGMLIIPRNTYKQIHEYAYEALDILGKPSSVNEITEKVKELYPNTHITHTGVRSALRRAYGFIPMGRSSYFGLKKWEKSIKNFKGGTIRDIVREYLQDKSLPISLKEIIQYLAPYRPNARSKSVLTNLKADASDTFVFFQRSYVGLKGKEYPEDYEIIIEKAVKRRTWEENYNSLSDFVQKNGRLPISSEKTPQVIILYRWISVQKNLMKNHRLTPEKEKLFQELIKVKYENTKS